MHSQKKKPRQRNRPRNKANHSQNLQNGASEVCDEGGAMGAMDSVQASHTEKLKDLCGAINKNMTATPNHPDETPAPSQNNNDAIKIIQQLLRAKILKQNKDIGGESKDSNEVKDAGDAKDITDVVGAKDAKDVKDSKEVNDRKDTIIKPNKKNSNENSVNIKKSKSKERVVETSTEKNAFIANLQKKMESVMAANGSTDLPNTLLENLQSLLNQDPISDVESSDDEDEFIEYIYKPRQYFLVSLCNLCKCDLRSRELIQCSRCKMTYYCSPEHMKTDVQHKQLCYALRQVADNFGTHIFYKCGDFTTEQFRSYRIVTIRKVESAINRPLTATEQEVVLFPRICCNVKCREYRFDKLMDCSKCGQVAFCKDKPEHFNKFHNLWCKPYQLFKELVMFQEKFGRLDPSLPSKVLKDIPGACSNTKQILNKLAFDMHDPCEYAALSQISTGPLTAWYALRLCDQLKKSEIMTVHLIGAEIEFEVDVLHKWELFFLHITPTVKELNVVFVGPELNPRNISFDQLKKTKCCRVCRKRERTVKYHFENRIYHNYCGTEKFLKPDLICFFNAGLYRSTGFHMEDTWPETILAAANSKCPIVVTSYTSYEAPLDMTRFVQESNRRLNVVLPPTVNPFSSDKPERNFISDEDAPLMFKNYYCFIVE